MCMCELYASLLPKLFVTRCLGAITFATSLNVHFYKMYFLLGVQGHVWIQGLVISYLKLALVYPNRGLIYGLTF